MTRVLDVGCALGAALVTLPLCLLCGVLTVMETGRPMFYGSMRLGQYGRPFRCWKIRTMVYGADDCGYYKPDVDRRVTRVGYWLRKLSLDELPQLWNVLVGEMAIFGPRPFRVEEYPLLGQYAHDIMSRKPGVINAYTAYGRSNLSVEQRLQLDAKFARRMNVRQCGDALVRTLIRIVTTKGAK